MTKQRASQSKSTATSSEVSSLRAALGTLSYRASQTAPHLQSDVSLLLSEGPMATVNTLNKVNKLIQEAKRESTMTL